MSAPADGKPNKFIQPDSSLHGLPKSLPFAWWMCQRGRGLEME